MNKYRMTLALAFAGALCLAEASYVRADDIQVRVDGDMVHFSGIGPQQIEGRVMVPLRGVLEKLGAQVGWVQSTRTVFASKGNMDLQLPIGSRTARVNGKDVTLDVPAMTIAGTTMVPLRFVGETLGADVRWNGTTQTVSIVTNGRSNDTNPPPQPEPPRDAPTITSLSHNQSGKWLRGGETVYVTLKGPPGGTASFRIPGLADETPMQETSRGHYSGKWIVDKNKTIQNSGAAIIGSLKVGGRSAPMLQAGKMLKIDTTAPRISDIAPPANGRMSTRRPLISATFSDQGGSGIDANRTRLLLNDRAVTDEAEITNRFFTFRPRDPLTARSHRVDLYVYDKAGNEAHQRWNFELTEAAQIGIKSVKANAEDTLEPGDVLDIRMEGAPGGKAVFQLGSIKNRALSESSPGVYTGSYTIRKGDDIANAPVTVTMTTPEGEKFTSSTERSLQVTTGRPVSPIITFPKETGAITNPLIVRGTAAPNSTVRLKIDYVNPVLGVLAVRGTAAEMDIPVDKNGKWASDGIDISSLFNSKDTKYTITAATVSPNEEVSSPTTLRLTRR